MSTLTTIEKVKMLRQEIQLVIDLAEDAVATLLDSEKKAGREFALVKTKLQEARMWAGQSLSHFDTGFVPSDMPSK